MSDTIDIATHEDYAEWRRRLDAYPERMDVSTEPACGFYRHKRGGAVAVWRTKAGIRLKNSYVSDGKRSEANALWDAENGELVPWPLIFDTVELHKKRLWVAGMWVDSCGHPVSPEQYRAAVESPIGAWDDVDEETARIALEETRLLRDTKDDIEQEARLDDFAFRAIDRLVERAKLYATIEDERTQAFARSVQTSLAKFRLRLDKRRKALNEPLQAQVKANNDAFNPHIEAAEKREKAIKSGIESFATLQLRRQREKERLEQEQRERERRAEEARLQEEFRKAQEEAAALDPDAAPADVRLHNAPPADDDNPLGLPPVEPPAIVPAPAGNGLGPADPLRGQVRGGIGRAGALKSQIEVEAITDFAALAGHFQNNTDVRALLIKLANAAIKAGLTVPGVSTHEVAKLKG